MLSKSYFRCYLNVCRTRHTSKRRSLESYHLESRSLRPDLSCHPLLLILIIIIHVCSTYVCLHTHTQTHVHTTYIQRNINTYMQTFIDNIYRYIYIYIYKYIYICMCVYIYLYLSINIYYRVYTNIYTYVHILYAYIQSEQLSDTECMTA